MVNLGIVWFAIAVVAVGVLVAFFFIGRLTEGHYSILNVLKSLHKHIKAVDDTILSMMRSPSGKDH